MPICSIEDCNAPTEAIGLCHKHYQRHYRKNNLKAVQQIERNRSLRIRGLTQETYGELLRQQGGGCAICGTTTPGPRRKNFCADHDHSTGKTRGLLCVACNIMLGHAKDNVTRLLKAIDYLTSHRKLGAA